MQLTSKEQAMLTIAVDRILQDASNCVGSYQTTDMWAALYDDIICADIDDVGEEYDPTDEGEITLVYNEDGSLDFDAGLVSAFAKDLIENVEDEDDKDEVIDSFVKCMSDDMAWQMYDALNDRFDRKFEADAEAAAERSAQIDLEEFIDGLKGLHVDNTPPEREKRAKRLFG